MYGTSVCDRFFPSSFSCGMHQQLHTLIMLPATILLMPGERQKRQQFATTNYEYLNKPSLNCGMCTKRTSGYPGVFWCMWGRCCFTTQRRSAVNIYLLYIPESKVTDNLRKPRCFLSESNLLGANVLQNSCYLCHLLNTPELSHPCLAVCCSVPG